MEFADFKIGSAPPLPRNSFDPATEFERYSGNFTKAELRTAVLASYSSMCRQAIQGKREVDRDDAINWLTEWKPMVEALREKSRK